jgi:inner membrane protein
LETVTHLLIGGLTGAAFSPATKTRRMMAAGSLIQIVPDLDVVASLWMTPAEAMVAHRGFTHSFLFAAMFALFLSSWLPHSRALDRSPGFWLAHSFVQLVLHDLLDAFNAYGTAWFLPFDNIRISFHSLFVADPLFSLGPAVGIVFLLVLRKNHRLIPFIPYFSLIWCFIFLTGTLILKERILESVRLQPELNARRINQAMVTPMPFSSLLWFVSARSDSGYFIGYRSVFDNKPEIRFRFIPKNEKYAEPFSGNPELKILIKFSGDDWLMTTDDSDGRKEYYFTNLRFGIRPGWDVSEPLRSTDFVFRYPVSAGTPDRAMLQRGRMSGFDKEGITELLKKIFPSSESVQSPK